MLIKYKFPFRKIEKKRVAESERGQHEPLSVDKLTSVLLGAVPVTLKKTFAAMCAKSLGCREERSSEEVHATTKASCERTKPTGRQALTMLERRNKGAKSRGRRRRGDQGWRCSKVQHPRWITKEVAAVL
jgi:hypothetical protein